MSPDQIGRRYERLLVLTGPVSFAAFVVLFVAVASDTQKERAQARCYEFAAEAISKARKELEPLWDVAKKEKTSSYGNIDYRYSISGKLIVVSKIECFDGLKAELDVRVKASPEEIVRKYLADAKELKRKPLQLYDIEMPEKATINIIGTSISIGLITFTQFLQILLGPLMLLWLSSLYCTRYRETITIGVATRLSDVFPHVVNVYPFGTFPEARKRNWFIYHLPKVVAVCYAFMRIFLACVFLVPPVLGYLLSLYFFSSEQYVTLFFVLGGLVFMSCGANLLLEFMPWHFRKVFSPPNART